MTVPAEQDDHKPYPASNFTSFVFSSDRKSGSLVFTVILAGCLWTKESREAGKEDLIFFRQRGNCLVQILGNPISSPYMPISDLEPNLY